jgi:hypothetical protein
MLVSIRIRAQGVAHKPSPVSNFLQKTEVAISVKQRRPKHLTDRWIEYTNKSTSCITVGRGDLDLLGASALRLPKSSPSWPLNSLPSLLPS